MKLALLIFLSAFQVLAQTPSVFDRNCESYAREKKFIAPKSVLDLDKNTERYFLYDNLTPAYGQVVSEVNKAAPGYYKTPNRAPIHACSGVALNQCLSFKAYCTETIAKAAVKEDLAEWKVVATNCQNPKYRERNPASHCQNDALKQLQYVYDQTLHLAKFEAGKNPEAARFFNESAKEFAKYHDDMKSLIAAQKKIDDAKKENERQKSLTLELAQSMKNCSDVVKDDGDDVQNRNIAGRIVSGLGCRDDLASLNQPQIKELKNDIDKILDHIDTKVVLDQTNAIALEKTATAYWASKRQLSGATLESEASAIKMICSEKSELCEDKLALKTLSDSYKKSVTKLKAVTPLTDSETSRLLQTEFNPLVKEINSYCQKANAEYHKIKAQNDAAKEANNPKLNPYKEYATVAIDNTRVAKTFNEDHFFGEMLLAAGNKTLQDKFSELLDSKLGHLMMSKSLQEKVGIYNPAKFRANCAGGGGTLLKLATVSDINHAKAGFSELLTDEIDKLTESQDASGAHSRKSALQNYLKSNPLTIAELLKNNPSPEYAKLMCYLIRDINSSDQNWEYLKTGVTVIGVAASVALAATGVGAPAGAALFTAVTLTTAVSAGASLDDYFAHKEEARLSLQAGATNQDGKSASIERSLSEDKKADESFKEFATTVVLEATGFGVTKIAKNFVRPGAAAKLINSSDEVLEVADDVVRAPAKVIETPKLEGKKLTQVEVEYDIPKVKVKTRPAPSKAASRFDPENLSPENKRYLEFIENTDPNVERKVIVNTETSTEKLAQMYGNENPKDMAYLLNKNKVKHIDKGGEAAIYVNPKNDKEALKVWHANRKDDFDLSVKTVMHFEKKVEQNKELSKVFTVSRVKEFGPNYIVKDFYPKSLPIGNVTNAQDLKKMNAAIAKIKQQTLLDSDILNQKLYQSLLKKSDNIHWDPVSEKVILIDALGF